MLCTCMSPFQVWTQLISLKQHGMNVSPQLMCMCYASMTNVKATGDEFFTLSR